MTFAQALRKIGIRGKRLIHHMRLSRLKKLQRVPLTGPRVLVAMNNIGIGNAVEATPLVQAIRVLWPTAIITLLTGPGDLFDDWSVPDRITASTEDLKGKSYDHTFFPYGRWQNIAEWQASFELGRVHCPRVWLRVWLLKPEVEYNVDMIRRLGYRGVPPPLYVSLKQPKEHIPPGILRICLVPGGKTELMWRHKRWPYYNELIHLLLEEYPQVQICIMGTQDDDFPGDLTSDRRVIDLRSHLTLRQTAWVLKHAGLAIGNDCGPMHIADAVQTPSIVLFGPTCELKNAPRDKAISLSIDLPCRPCQYCSLIETCQKPICMTELTPNIVMEKVKIFLERHSWK